MLGFKLFYGAKGLKNIPKYSNFANVFICVVITCFAIHAMMKSRHGRAVLAIRDNEIAAESCGIQTTYYKVMAFAFSAAFAGLAGGLYACYLGVLDPSTFGFMAGAGPHDDLPSGRPAWQLRLLHEPHCGKDHERRTVPEESKGGCRP
ncbi:leucine/isoleucine/valine transporter permease subunit [Alistipes sp. cv1]|nr:leucine/isoleucine/valine transporter permease subunit [Faecalibacterium prausnitzii]